MSIVLLLFEKMYFVVVAWGLCFKVQKRVIHGANVSLFQSMVLPSQLSSGLYLVICGDAKFQCVYTNIFSIGLFRIQYIVSSVPYLLANYPLLECYIYTICMRHKPLWETSLLIHKLLVCDSAILTELWMQAKSRWDWIVCYRFCRSYNMYMF